MSLLSIACHAVPMHSMGDPILRCCTMCICHIVKLFYVAEIFSPSRHVSLHSLYLVNNMLSVSLHIVSPVVYLLSTNSSDRGRCGLAVRGQETMWSCWEAMGWTPPRCFLSLTSVSLSAAGVSRWTFILPLMSENHCGDL